MSTSSAFENARPWSIPELIELFELPLMDVVMRAQEVHRAHHRPNAMQLSTLLSIKTGACPEDCAYCPQSSRYETSVEAQGLMPIEDIVAAAKAAQANGAERFCMGAAWRSPTARQLDSVADAVREVKALGLETCVTLGMLKDGQAEQLREAGLDYYNHNLDSSPDFYPEIITTRCYQDRLDTLRRAHVAGLNVCCGGIVGMGETREQRAGLIAELSALSPQPESVPINHLVKVPGTPLSAQEDLDPFEFVRTIAVTRVAMPRSVVRLSAGRETMSDELQALCFLAGANSLFYGDQLLTTANPQAARDRALFERLGIETTATVATSATAVCAQDEADERLEPATQTC